VEGLARFVAGGEGYVLQVAGGVGDLGGYVLVGLRYGFWGICAGGLGRRYRRRTCSPVSLVGVSNCTRTFLDGY